MALRLAVVVSQAPGLGAHRQPATGGRERLGRRLLGDVEVTEGLARAAATTRALSSWWPW